MEDVDGGFDRSNKSVDGALDGGFNLRLMNGEVHETNGGVHCFYSRYFHWRQDRLKAGLDGARTI